MARKSTKTAEAEAVKATKEIVDNEQANVDVEKTEAKEEKLYTVEEVNDILRNFMAQKDAQIRALSDTREIDWIKYQVSLFVDIIKNDVSFPDDIVDRCVQGLRDFFKDEEVNDNNTKEEA